MIDGWISFFMGSKNHWPSRMTETWIWLDPTGIPRPSCLSPGEKGHRGLPFVHGYHGAVCCKVTHGRSFLGYPPLCLTWPTTWDHKNHKIIIPVTWRGVRSLMVWQYVSILAYQQTPTMIQRCYNPRAFANVVSKGAERTHLTRTH